MLTLRLTGRMLPFASSWNTALQAALKDSGFNVRVRGQGSLPCLSASEISGSGNYRFQLQKLRIVLRKKTKLDSSSQTDLQNLCQRLKKKIKWHLGPFICHTISWVLLLYAQDFPGGSDDKASVYNAGDPGSIPGWQRSPGEGNGNSLQHPCLENPMDRRAW